MYIIVTFITLIVVTLSLQIWYRKKINVPGPMEYPWIANYPELINIDSRLIELAHRAITIYKGNTFTFKIPFIPRFIVCCDPRNVEHILKANFENYIKGNYFHTSLMELLGDGIFNIDGERWKIQRKTASHMFSANEFRNNMTQVFHQHVKLLLRELDYSNAKQEQIDIHNLFYRFTLDSIGEIAFGVNIGSMEKPDNPFANAFDDVQAIIEKRFFDPFWKLKYWFSTDAARLRQQVKVLNEYAYNLIQTRRETRNYLKRSDVLSRFMRLCEETLDTSRNDQYLRDIIMNFLIAGRDTTAQALSWAVYLIAQHPKIEAKMREEIDTVLGHQDDSDESTGIPTYDQTKQLAYVAAVIKETLRLYPSVPKDAKLCVNNDQLPDGTFVPKGCFVVYFPYAMGRLESLWENPFEFNPDRFIENPKPSPFHYPVFQAGPRTCLGQHMALFEAITVLAALYKKYTIKLVNPFQVTPMDSLTMPMLHGMYVQVYSRSN